MTAQTNQDKESGAAPPRKFSQENGFPSDHGHGSQEKGQSLSHKTDEQEAPPSRHLWVGNVSTSLTEATIQEQFSRFGDIDGVTVYSSRNYAFVNFKTIEDAVYAKKGLQGANLGGLTVRIEFAKGAKPCRHLYIGNICSTVTKEELEAEFKKFGTVEDVRFLWDRNCAFVDFTKTDDAVSAYEVLNRKKLGKLELWIEYGRSHLQSKKDSKLDAQSHMDENAIFREHRSPDFLSAPDCGKTAIEKSKGNKDGDLGDVLWIGFPIYMKVDKDKLQRAFEPFGGIEKITTFPGRTYAFVQFRSLREACRAKDALQGKLFNDPRVNISFAKSEVGPVDHSRGITTFLSPSPPKLELSPTIPFSKAGNIVNPRNDRFLGLSTFRPNSPSFGTRAGAELKETSAFFQSHLYDLEPNLSMGSELSRGLRPGYEGGLRSEMEILGSPSMREVAFPRPNQMPSEDRWNVQEDALGKRDLKRQRVGVGHPGSGGLIEVGSLEGRGERQSLQVVKAQDYLSRITRLNGSEAVGEDEKTPLAPPEVWEDQEVRKRVLQGRTALTGSIIDLPRSERDEWGIPGIPSGPSKDNIHWQGIIAKSGTSVCHARCFPVGKSIDTKFPEVVNCTARTNLDMLSKHLSQAGGFAAVSFVPQGELDIGPYQDFMIYLSEKKRAAVCKISHESTLFLVPPSEFVEWFLKVPKSNSIFGVVLRLHPQQHQLPQILPEPPPLQTQQLLSISGLTEERYQKPALHLASEQQSSGFLAMHVPSNAVPSMEMMTSHPLLPHPSSLQPVSSAGTVLPPGMLASLGGMPGNIFGKGLAGMNNPQGDIRLPTDDIRLAHQPQAYPPVQHNQLNTSLVGSFGLPSSGEFRSHQEQGMPLHSQTSASLPGPLASVSTQQYSVTAPSQSQSQMKFNNYHLPGSIPYQQLPRPSNMQLSQSDQLSQLTSLLAYQQQPSDNLQLSQQNLPQQLSLSGQQYHMQHQVSASNVALTAAPLNTGLHQLHPTGAFFQGGDLEMLTEAKQREVLQLLQQKPSTESHTKGDSDEDQKRFKATLELAAALLQQLQQRTKT